MTTANCGSLAMPIAQAMTGACVGCAPASSVVRSQELVNRPCGVSAAYQRLQLPYWSGLKSVAVSTLKADEIHGWQKIRRKLGVVRASVADQNSVSIGAPPVSAVPIKKETDVGVLKVAEDTFTLRGRITKDRFKYEIEYGLKRGTTENSYLIKGSSGTALIDVMDQGFAEAFTNAVAGSVDLGNIKYLIVGHFSPKRLESLKSLLQARPVEAKPIDVYCSNPAALLLRNSLADSPVEKSISIKVVRPGDGLDLGGGHELQFILTPTPRWPDGMCTYDPATQLLFSQKIFSAHVCEPNDYDIGGWDAYGEDWRYFYDCMLGPSPRQAEAALGKLPVVAQYTKPSYKGRTGVDVVKADVKFLATTVLEVFKLPISKSLLFDEGEGKLVTTAICPLHGPIVRSTITELVREYGEWTTDKLKHAADATIAVIYASAYGNTTALAQAISRGISKAGVGIETLNMEVCSTEELISSLQRCSGFVIGSPTLGGHMPTPISNALGVILRDDNSKVKPCGVFGSFGWSGEAVDMIEQRLKDCDFTLAFPTIRCKFKPTEATLQLCEESGTDLAQAVKRFNLKRRTEASPQFTVASNVEQAVGRVVGSLCVLTARDGDAESAMLASWVSQASFVPPGLTVAVAKDRAVEGLVLVGGKFVLNVLGQNKSGAIAKQLLKPFKPGEPRLAGLETKVASNGGVILNDAISWMECTVRSRLETGDHWVLYATVEAGALQDDKTLTAVHYRKTGARY